MCQIALSTRCYRNMSVAKGSKRSVLMKKHSYVNRHYFVCGWLHIEGPIFVYCKYKDERCLRALLGLDCCEGNIVARVVELLHICIAFDT